MANRFKVPLNKPNTVRYIPSEGDYFTFGDSDLVYQCFPRDYGMDHFRDKGDTSNKLYAICLHSQQLTWFEVPGEFKQLIPSKVEKGAIIFEQVK